MDHVYRLVYVRLTIVTANFIYSSPFTSSMTVTTEKASPYRLFDDTKDMKLYVLFVTDETIWKRKIYQRFLTNVNLYARDEGLRERGRVYRRRVKRMMEQVMANLCDWQTNG